MLTFQVLKLKILADMLFYQTICQTLLVKIKKNEFIKFLWWCWEYFRQFRKLSFTLPKAFLVSSLHPLNWVVNNSPICSEWTNPGKSSLYINCSILYGSISVILFIFPYMYRIWLLICCNYRCMKLTFVGGAVRVLSGEVRFDRMWW